MNAPVHAELTVRLMHAAHWLETSHIGGVPASMPPVPPSLPPLPVPHVTVMTSRGVPAVVPGYSSSTAPITMWSPMCWTVPLQSPVILNVPLGQPPEPQLAEQLSKPGL